MTFSLPWIYQLEYQRNLKIAVPSVGKVYLPLGKRRKAESSPIFPRNWLLLILVAERMTKGRRGPGQTHPFRCEVYTQLGVGTQLPVMRFGQVSTVLDLSSLKCQMRAPGRIKQGKSCKDVQTVGTSAHLTYSSEVLMCVCVCILQALIFPRSVLGCGNHCWVQAPSPHPQPKPRGEFSSGRRRAEGCTARSAREAAAPEPAAAAQPGQPSSPCAGTARAAEPLSR